MVNIIVQILFLFLLIALAMIGGYHVLDILANYLVNSKKVLDNHNQM
jgi:hypothetical protein